MHAYKTTVECAADIRAALKKYYAISSRMASVTVPHHGKISISINSHLVDVREVENVANKYEEIRYCQHSGDILEGGNRFLSVAYSPKASALYLQENIAIIEQIASFVPPVEAATCGKSVEHDGGSYFLTRHNWQLMLYRSHETETTRRHSVYEPKTGVVDLSSIAAAMLAMRSMK